MQSETDLAFYYANYQAFTAHYGLFEPQVTTHSSRLNVSEVDISLEPMRVYMDDRIHSYPIITFKSEKSNIVRIGVGAWLILEGLAKFIELEHLKSIWGASEYEHTLEKEEFLLTMLPYYALWHYYRFKIRPRSPDPLEFIVICELSLQFDVMMSDYDYVRGIFSLPSEKPSDKQREEWDRVLSRDHGPGFFFMNLIETLSSNKHKLPHIDVKRKSSWKDFASSLLNLLQDRIGKRTEVNLSAVKDVITWLRSVLPFSGSLFNIMEKGIDIRSEVGLLLSPLLVDPKKSLDIITSVPVLIEFNDGVVRFDKNINHMEYSKSSYEISILEGLAFRSKVRCPYNGSIVCGPVSDQGIVCKNTLPGSDLSPSSQCDFLSILRGYMKALNIKHIRNHHFNNSIF